MRLSSLSSTSNTVFPWPVMDILCGLEVGAETMFFLGAGGFTTSDANGTLSNAAQRGRAQGGVTRDSAVSRRIDETPALRPRGTPYSASDWNKVGVLTAGVAIGLLLGAASA